MSKDNKPKVGVLDKEIRTLMTPDAIKDLEALNPTVQQFLLRFTDLREKVLSDQLKEEMKQFLLEVHEAENDAMCKNIAEIVAAQNKKMFDAFGEMASAITGIAEDVRELKKNHKELFELHMKDIGSINERFLDEDNKIKDIYSRLEKKRGRIDKLEERMETIKSLENAGMLMHGFNKRLDLVEKHVEIVEKHTNIYWEFFRTFAIVALVSFLTLFGHAKGWW